MNDRAALPRAAIVATAVVAVFAVIAVVAANAPANWLAAWVARTTADRVLLADAQGTIWSGSAVVAIGGPDRPDPRAGPARPAERLALPGRVTWTLDWTRPLAPVLHLTHDGVLMEPLVARAAGGRLALDAGSASLPASLLRLYGAPLNTLSPDGLCTIRWSRVVIDADGVPVGDGTLRVAGLTLALSPVRPLGDYLVTWSSGTAGLAWTLATERGPLAADGSGRTTGSRSQMHVVVKAAAGTPPAVVAQLGPLLDLIGRRGPDEAIIDAAS